MKTEPVLIAQAVVAIIAAAIIFGVKLPDGWQAGITAAIIAVGALFTRSQVSPAPPAPPTP